MRYKDEPQRSLDITVQPNSRKKENYIKYNGVRESERNSEGQKYLTHHRMDRDPAYYRVGVFGDGR